MFKYSTPAGIDDLHERPTRSDFLDDWHGSVKRDFLANIGDLPPTHQLFFTETVSPATSAEIPITWNAFPLSISRVVPNNPIQRWDAADRLGERNRSVDGTSVLKKFRFQDEYCEWFAYRQTPGGPISRIVFTAEAPEYWIMLAKHDFQAVFVLYKSLVSPEVQEHELKLTKAIRFGNSVLNVGDYDPYNVWNTEKGVMHLTHPANTLGAEINLAAVATIPIADIDNNRVTEVRRLACSSVFGDPNRSSDPSIGHGVNMTALPTTLGAAAQSITLANPVALYIDDIANGAITDENGDPLAGWFTIVRGVRGRGLMAVLEPPPGAAIGLGQIRIGNRSLTHGGQVAERIQMVLYGKTANLGHPVPPLFPRLQHCCRPNNSAQVNILNLDHEELENGCSSGNVDAFPELRPDPPGPAAEVALVAEQLVFRSSFARTRSGL